MAEDCLFCKIAAEEIAATIRYQDSRVIVFEDVSPQAPHHLLIIPRRHIRTTLDLTPEENELIGHIYQIARQVAQEDGFAEAGFRIVNNCNLEGGQAVWHLHFHLLAGRQMGWPPG
jgi:histidine triad (HIT) family protein